MSNVRKGLVNLGNTCYMNSFLQALYAMEDYREALLSMDEADFLLKEDSKPTVQAKVKLGIY
jgi:ubiquitin C-terminal hydrolase